MAEQTKKADWLDLLQKASDGQIELATVAHQSLVNGAALRADFITTPAQLAKQAAELAASAQQTTANAASAPSVAGRQLDYLHAQSGALVDQCERYIAQVRLTRENLLHTQHVSALGYTDFQSGLKAESEAHQLSVTVVALESFVLTIKGVAHQAVAQVTAQMHGR